METSGISQELLSEVWKGLASYRKIPRLIRRIADGLSNREIAIISPESFDSLKLAMLESGIFEEENISQVSPDAPEKLDDKDLILLDYAAIGNAEEAVVRKKLAELLDHKDRRDGLIVYCKPPLRIPNKAPQEIPADIPEEEREKEHWEKDLFSLIADTPNTVVVTQYGRLMSDILIMMMTTSNQKKKG